MVTANDDTSMARPTIANIGNTKCLLICPHYIMALFPYLQFYRINNEIFQRRCVDFFSRKVMSKILGYLNPTLLVDHNLLQVLVVKIIKQHIAILYNE